MKTDSKGATEGADVRLTKRGERLISVSADELSRAERTNQVEEGAAPQAFHTHRLYCFVCTVERKVVITLWKNCAEPRPAPCQAPSTRSGVVTPPPPASVHIKLPAPPVDSKRPASHLTEELQH